MSKHVAFLLFLSRLPLQMRRGALRAAWWCGLLTGRLPQLKLGELLRYALNASDDDVQRIEREIVFQDWLLALEWSAGISRTKEQATRDSRHIAFEQTATLEDLAKAKTPVIFAPLHMGSYAFPFAVIMKRYFPDRRLLVLRAREDYPEHTQAMKRISEIGVEMQFLNVADKNAYLNAARFAREGAIIVLFVDLPGSYGSPVPVDLFGRPMQLAMGIGSLARAVGAMVVPIAITSTVSGDVVKIGRPFECNGNGLAERQRVTGRVCRHIETSVTASPESWHMWFRLGEFYAPRSPEEVSS